jgi:MarR family transcriptional regulator, transcriptional regulator for hemolysin
MILIRVFDKDMDTFIHPLVYNYWCTNDLYSSDRMTSVRKLDIENSPGALLFLASKSQERLAEVEMKKQLGLTPAHWKIILALSMNNGLTQKEIADRIYVDGSTLVPIIDKMEENGLVERKSDSKDRRINRIFLTKKSESTVDSIVETVLQLRKIIYHGISENDLDLVKTTLKTIIKNSENASENKSSPDKS